LDLFETLEYRWIHHLSKKEWDSKTTNVALVTIINIKSFFLIEEFSMEITFSILTLFPAEINSMTTGYFRELRRDRSEYFLQNGKIQAIARDFLVVLKYSVFSFKFAFFPEDSSQNYGEIKKI